MTVLSAYLRQLRDETAARSAAGEALELEHVLDHRLLLIVGAPHTGKTAFLHHLAFLLICGIEDTRIDSVPFPILIRLPDLGGGNDSPRHIVEFLNARNRERGWNLPDDYMERKLFCGLAVLLLDDLDLAPGAQRLVENAAEEFRYSRFVVTARAGPALRGFHSVRINPPLLQS